MSDSHNAVAVPEKRPKPPQLTGGSRKGVPNKVTAQLKDMILQALDGAGGVAYLIDQAEKNPGPFMTLVGKVLPLQLTGENGGAIQMTVDMTNAPDDVVRYLAGQAVPSGDTAH